MLVIKVLYFLILVIPIVICEDCRIFNFENGTEDLISTYNVCNSLAEWNRGEYTSIPSITPYHEKSTSFIEPSSTGSCIATEPFSMTGNGVIEVIVYIESAANQEMISAIINRIDEAGQEAFVRNDIIFSSLISGWYNWSIEISGTANYNAYVAFITNDKSEGSIVLIDSFRYIPPMYTDNNSCNIYDDDEDNIVGGGEEEAEDGNETEDGGDTGDGNESEEENVTEGDGGTEDGNEPDGEDGEEIEGENVTEGGGGTEDGNEPDGEDGEEIEGENVTEGGGGTEDGNEPDGEDGEEIEEENETEDGDDNDDIDNPEEENGGDGDGDENGEEDAIGQDSKEENTESPITVTDVPSFWTPLTIGAIAALGVIVIVVVSSTFYQLGKNRAEKENKIVMLDIDQMPQIRILPRINKLYYKNNMNNPLYI